MLEKKDVKTEEGKIKKLNKIIIISRSNRFYAMKMLTANSAD